MTFRVSPGLICCSPSVATKTDIATSAPSDAVETAIEGLWLSVAQALGSKCDRCWHFTVDVGQHDAHPELCGRCVTNVDGVGEIRKFA